MFNSPSKAARIKELEYQVRSLKADVEITMKNVKWANQRVEALLNHLNLTTVWPVKALQLREKPHGSAS
jgi:hypothetical protein